MGPLVTAWDHCYCMRSLVTAWDHCRLSFHSEFRFVSCISVTCSKCINQNHHIQAQFFNYRQWRRHNKSVTTNDFGAKVNTHIWVEKFSDGARFWCAKAFSNAFGRLSTFISRDTVDFLPLWHQTRNWGGRLWSDIQVNRYLFMFTWSHLVG